MTRHSARNRRYEKFNLFINNAKTYAYLSIKVKNKINNFVSRQLKYCK
jgi:hypothetical protein